MRYLWLLVFLVPQDADWQKRIDALPEAEEAWYSYSGGGRRIGYVHLKTSAAGELLKVEMRLGIRRRGEVVQWKSESYLKKDRYLTPVRYEGVIEGQKLEAEFGDGKVTVNGKEQPLQGPVVTTEGEFLLVGTLPLEEGTRVEYSSFETEDMRAKPDHRLEVLGRETISGVEATRIRHSGSGCSEHYYWVDSDRRVIRMLFDGDKEMLLTDEETAVGE